ncbi:hypothetical protein ABW20_dc0102588 [Dactylellina cionopaga]|nr:hypothetical protein ABW20_dc0102588 [Dactylellina cionopaga]
MKNPMTMTDVSTVVPDTYWRQLWRRVIAILVATIMAIGIWAAVADVVCVARKHTEIISDFLRQRVVDVASSPWLSAGASHLDDGVILIGLLTGSFIYGQWYFYGQVQDDLELNLDATEEAPRQVFIEVQPSRLAPKKTQGPPHLPSRSQITKWREWMKRKNEEKAKHQKKLQWSKRVQARRVPKRNVGVSSGTQTVAPQYVDASTQTDFYEVAIQQPAILSSTKLVEKSVELGAETTQTEPTAAANRPPIALEVTGIDDNVVGGVSASVGAAVSTAKFGYREGEVDDCGNEKIDFEGSRSVEAGSERGAITQEAERGYGERGEEMESVMTEAEHSDDEVSEGAITVVEAGRTEVERGELMEGASIVEVERGDKVRVGASIEEAELEDSVEGSEGRHEGGREGAATRRTELRPILLPRSQRARAARLVGQQNIPAPRPRMNIPRSRIVLQKARLDNLAREQQLKGSKT